MHSKKTLLSTIALALTVIVTQASIPPSQKNKRSYAAVYRAEEEQILEATRMLFDAIDENDQQRIDLTLNNGADVDAISEKYQWLTPLMLAARYDNIYAVEAILMHDADIHVKNCRGVTALDEALTHNASCDLIKLLVLAHNLEITRRAKLTGINLIRTLKQLDRSGCINLAALRAWAIPRTLRLLKLNDSPLTLIDGEIWPEDSDSDRDTASPDDKGSSICYSPLNNG